MFLGWRELMSAKGRFFLITAVIFMITLLVQLLSGLTGGLAAQNISAIENLNAQKIVFNTLPESSNSFTSSSITSQQEKEWNEANPEHVGYPLGMTTTKAKSTDTQAAVTLFGVNPQSPIGEIPQQLNTGDVVVSKPAADALKIQAGDQIVLGAQSHTVTAVRGDDYYAHTPVVWVDTTLWQTLNRSSDKDEIGTVLIVPEPGDVATAAGLTAVTSHEALSAISSYEAENSSLQLMRAFLFVISALVVGAFFTVWTIQRSRDIAVLKALGASTKRLLLDALAQSAIILIFAILTASVVAVAIGIPAHAAGIPFMMSMSTFINPAIGLFVLGLAGAYLAVRRISSVDPLIALGSAR